MSSDRDPAANRRRFLQYLASSPLLAAGGASAFAETLVPKAKLPDPLMWAPLDATRVIKSPKEAINVFDLEPAMRQNVPPAHFGYMASGIDDEVTLRRNREDFLKFQLRPRRLVDVSKVDMSVDILGTKYDSPIVLAPVGGQRSFHDDGELGAARGAKAGNHLQIMSTMTSYGVEEVAKARGAPIWLQLYATNSQERGRGHRQALRERRLLRLSPSPSTAAAAATRKPCSGCGRATPATATAATTGRTCRRTSRAGPCSRASTSRGCATPSRRT